MPVSNQSDGVAQQQLPLAGPTPAKPFLKWAGGKRQLLPQIRPRVPARFGRYYEPFVGAGALFFDLCPRNATLGDANERLIRAYRGIRDDPEGVIDGLRGLPNQKDVFLAQRARDIDSESDTDVATWLVYLNRTAFNGLYRVNKQGGFNVPFGSYRDPKICDPQTIRAVSSALRDTTLVVGDFEETVSDAVVGDFVYFDPPYVPASRFSDFSRYTSQGFGPAEQVRLRDVAAQLKARGVNVLLSNSDTPEVRELYAEGFDVSVVSASRFINSKGDRRGKVDEVLIS